MLTNTSGRGAPGPVPTRRTAALDAMRSHGVRHDPDDRRGEPPCPVATRVTAAARTARDLYALGARATSVFGGRLCSDPGFAILLDLFLSKVDGRKLSVTSVCIGSRVAPATALRYISLLERAGCVERVADRNDGRRSYVVLTPKGWSEILDVLNPVRD